VHLSWKFYPFFGDCVGEEDYVAGLKSRAEPREILPIKPQLLSIGNPTVIVAANRMLRKTEGLHPPRARRPAR